MSPGSGLPAMPSSTRRPFRCSAAMLIFALCACGGAPDTVEVVRRDGSRTRWLDARAAACFRTLVHVAPGRARYTHSGASACGSALGLPAGDGELRTGQSLQVQDEHVVRRCTVAEVATRGVRLRCEERFDLRAFGQDRIEIDRSAVLLPYRDAPALRAASTPSAALRPGASSAASGRSRTPANTR